MRDVYILSGLFNRSKQASGKEQTEYIQYAQEVESALRSLEAQLHESDDSEEIIHNVMKMACEFYQGDWVGFHELDLELSVWIPYVWYNPRDNDQTSVLLAEVESFDFFTVISNEDYSSMFSLQQASMETPAPAPLEPPDIAAAVSAVQPKPILPKPAARLTAPAPQVKQIDTSCIKVGSVLQHKAFGLGTVKEINEGRAIVTFDGVDKLFPFPGAVLQGFMSSD